MAVVTGASLGIGRATAIALGKAGRERRGQLSLAIPRRPRKWSQIIEEAGSKAIAAQADVADLAAVEDTGCPGGQAVRPARHCRQQRRLQRPRVLLPGRHGRLSADGRCDDVGGVPPDAGRHAADDPAGGWRGDRAGQLAARVHSGAAGHGLQHVEGRHRARRPHRRHRGGRASHPHQP